MTPFTHVCATIYIKTQNSWTINIARSETSRNCNVFLIYYLKIILLFLYANYKDCRTYVYCCLIIYKFTTCIAEGNRQLIWNKINSAFRLCIVSVRTMFSKTFNNLSAARCYQLLTSVVKNN